MTDDTRTDAEDIEPTVEDDESAAVPPESPEAAPEAEPEVDWEAKARNAEAALSRQGREVGELRKQLAAAQPRPPAITRDLYEQSPPEVRQYLDYREREFQSLEASAVEAQYGKAYTEALDTFRRTVALDPSVRGQAKAFEIALNQLAAAAEETPPAPEPKPRPKAPSSRQIDPNRADSMPSADLKKLEAEAEQKRDPKSLQAVIAARLQAAMRG